jgi:hypothetical protein
LRHGATPSANMGEGPSQRLTTPFRRPL